MGEGDSDDEEFRGAIRRNSRSMAQLWEDEGSEGSAERVNDGSEDTCPDEDRDRQQDEEKFNPVRVAPHAGARIETRWSSSPMTTRTASLPTRERELKFTKLAAVATSGKSLPTP